MLDTALMDALARRPPIWAAGAQDWWDFTRSGRAKRGVGAMPAETRARDGFAQNEAGVWVRRSANTRSMAGKGLLTYPTRTNSIRNNSMAGANVGSTIPNFWFGTNPNFGITRTVVGLGTRNGLPTIQLRYAGTASANAQLILAFDQTTQIAAANGQSWTNSVFVSLIAGSLSNLSQFVLSAALYNSGGAYLSDMFPQTDVKAATASLDRYTQSGTIAQVGTAFILPYLFMSITNGQVYDFTIEVAAPQAEGTAVSFASPPILTSGSAATANGPQQVMDIGSRAALGVGGVLQAYMLGTAGITNPYLIAFNDGGASNRFVLFYNGTSIATAQTVGGVGGSSITVAAVPATGLVTVAFAASPSYQMARVVGYSAPSSIAGSYAGSALSKVVPGGNGFDAASNLYQLTKRLALWYGPMSQHFFDNVLWPKAQLLAQVA